MKKMLQSSAKQGELYMLQWANEMGIPMDDTYAIYAARSSHFHILQWLNDYFVGYFHAYDYRIFYEGINAANIPLLDWYYSNVIVTTPNPHFPSCVWVWAAKSGHVTVLDWLNDKPFNRYYDARFEAAEHGHVHVLEWLIAHEQNNSNELEWSNYAHMRSKEFNAPKSYRHYDMARLFQKYKFKLEDHKVCWIKTIDDALDSLVACSDLCSLIKHYI